ncbi:MAG: glycosyltransferase [Bacteroidetes bacterium]|nr:glycosyltransferase [Bacteroidota bacterium]
MTALLVGVVAILVVISSIVTLNMLAGPFLRIAGSGSLRLRDARGDEHGGAGTLPSVTICIPARNEERNIGTLLTMLREQTWPALTILVLDDHSEDQTASIVDEHHRADSRITLLRGAPLPTGWTGKNWACHQLAEEAVGEILLFVDADVQPSPDAVGHTIRAMRSFRADALSAFPTQLMHGLAANLVIPVMDVLLYAFLPLQLVFRSKAVSLAAANGQWFAFTRKAYTRSGGHAAVRGKIVEDVALARAVKREGCRMLLTVGSGSVACRMYEDVSEIREGFSKNFFAAFGFNTVGFLAALLLLLTLFVFPYAMLLTSHVALAATAVALNLYFRLLLSWRAGHSLISALFHPLGILAAVAIGLEAVRLRFQHGAVRWKNRDIDVGVGQ